MNNILLSDTNPYYTIINLNNDGKETYIKEVFIFNGYSPNITEYITKQDYSSINKSIQDIIKATGKPLNSKTVIYFMPVCIYLGTPATAANHGF